MLLPLHSTWAQLRCHNAQELAMGVPEPLQPSFWHGCGSGMSQTPRPVHGCASCGASEIQEAGSGLSVSISVLSGEIPKRALLPRATGVGNKNMRLPTTERRFWHVELTLPSRNRPNCGTWGLRSPDLIRLPRLKSIHQSKWGMQLSRSIRQLSSTA